MKKHAEDRTTFQETILDSIADGVFTVDKNWKITSFNKSAEKILGISRSDAIGKNCRDVFLADICDQNCVLRKTIATGKQIINKRVHIINSKGKKISINVSTAILKDSKGRIVGGVETFHDISVLEALRKEVLGKQTYADIITKDSKMFRIFSILPSIAKSYSTVLITGESGTGKELMARAIHSLSDRANGPFITVNCGALPDNLLESELFGYKKGAFTDAKNDKPGRFKLAEGGTLFLDEIGDISKTTQVKLLRALQEKTFEPLGSVKSEMADVRILTATNQNLEDLVKQNEFRKDLYYRINILNVELPPLRERKGDIPILVENFLEKFNNIYQKNITGLSQDAITFLMNYDFPGNIRELQNIIEHGFIICPSGQIKTDHFPENLLKQKAVYKVKSGQKESLKKFERTVIINALQENKYNKRMTAAELGMHETTLWRKMKKLGIK